MSTGQAVDKLSNAARISSCLTTYRHLRASLHRLYTNSNWNPPELCSVLSLFQIEKGLCKTFSNTELKVRVLNTFLSFDLPALPHFTFNFFFSECMASLFDQVLKGIFMF